MKEVFFLEFFAKDLHKFLGKKAKINIPKNIIIKKEI
jgi:hypothetical protein